MAHRKLSATFHAFDHGEPIAVRVAVNDSDEANQNDLEGLPGLWSVTFGPWEAEFSMVGSRRTLITALRSALAALEGPEARGECTGTEYAVNPDFPDEGIDVHHSAPCPVHPDALPPREEWTPEQDAAVARIAGAVL